MPTLQEASTRRIRRNLLRHFRRRPCLLDEASSVWSGKAHYNARCMHG